MRRTLPIAAITAVAAVLGFAGVAGAQARAQDSVTASGGGGLTSIARFSFEIDAHSGPGGENPTGTALLSLVAGLRVEGQVTCLAVNGSAATLTAFLNPSGDPHTFTITVLDSPTGDRIGFAFDEKAPTDCSPLAFTEPITRGDIVVTDALPAADVFRAVQEQRLEGLRRLQEPGRLRQLRGDQGKEPTGQ